MLYANPYFYFSECSDMKLDILIWLYQTKKVQNVSLMLVEVVPVLQWTWYCFLCNICWQNMLFCWTNVLYYSCPGYPSWGLLYYLSSGGKRVYLTPCTIRNHLQGWNFHFFNYFWSVIYVVYLLVKGYQVLFFFM